MRIHQALFTSGMGGGYRIINSSHKIPPRIIEIVEKKALVKGLLPPDVSFIDAIRKFRCHEYICISYITNAGTDELGRAGRLRAHVLFIPKSISSRISDPRVFSEYFLKEDKTEKMHPIEIDVNELYDKLEEVENKIINLKEKIIGALGEQNLTRILKHLLLGNDIYIYPNRKIDILNVFSDKITGTDIIALIMLITPDKFRDFIEYSTVSFSQGDDVNLSFIWPYTEQTEIHVSQSSKYLFFRERKVEKLVNELSQLFRKDLGKFRLLKSLITLYIESIEVLKDPRDIDRMLSVCKNIYEGFLQ